MKLVTAIVIAQWLSLVIFAAALVFGIVAETRAQLHYRAVCAEVGC